MEQADIRQAVPFFRVTAMDRSLRFYMEGLGATMKHKWVDEGRLKWCWLELGGAAIMLQEFPRSAGKGQEPCHRPRLQERLLTLLGAKLLTPSLGEGVSISFQCGNALALYRAVVQKGLSPRKPFVGNRMWVMMLSDPDGYKLEFESPTGDPEETEYSGQPG